MNSFRAEAAGLATMVLQKNVRPRRFHWENKALVEKLNSITPLHPLSPDWELVVPIRLVFQDASTSIHHVKRRQDEEKRPLTPQDRWNVTEDELARHGRNIQNNYHPLPGYVVQLTIQNIPISSAYAQQIRHEFHSPNIAEYYSRRYQWDPSTIQLLDWNGFQQVIKDYIRVAKPRFWN